MTEEVTDEIKAVASRSQTSPSISIQLHLPPHNALLVLLEIAEKGTIDLFLNPGTESPDVVAKAKELGLSPILACSIIAVGANPNAF